MKRIITMIIILVFIAQVSYAADLSAGEQLRDYGLINGDQSGNLLENQEMTRAEFVKTLVILLNEEEKALDMDLSVNPFNDVKESDWYASYAIYAYENDLVKGIEEGIFAPDLFVDNQMTAMLLLRALDYEVSWNKAIFEAEVLGIDVPKEETINRGSIFEMILSSLAIEMKSSEVTLGGYLDIEDYKVELKPSEDDEYSEKEPVSIESAQALTDRMIEVIIEDQATEINNVDFKIIGDLDYKILDQYSSKWKRDEESIIIELDASLTPGDLYTVASGNSEVNFGGLSAPEKEPELVTFEKIDNDSIELTFNRIVKIENLEMKINQAYGDQDILEILSVDYKENELESIVVKIGKQSDATLYKLSIEQVEDLWGNTGSKIEETFTGENVDNAHQSIESLEVKDAYTIEITYAYKYDENTLNKNNYIVIEKYLDKKEIPIESVEKKISEDTIDLKTIIVKLDEPTNIATLYQLNVENVESVYGQTLEDNKYTKTFTGIGVDDEAVTGVEAKALSSRSIEIVIDDNSPISEDIDLGFFSIKEKYGNEDPLPILGLKEVDVDNNKIIIKTETQEEATLYSLTVEKGFVDAYGNITKEDLTETFTGIPEEKAIDDFSVINYEAGKLRVTFNRKHGEGALDISNYSIGPEIGYPGKVEAIDNNEESVILHVSGLEKGEIYDLAIKNIYNIDGIPMSEKSITEMFGGTYE